MLTETEIKAAQEFWKWFEENRLPFEFVSNMEPEQVDEISERIHEAVAPLAHHLSINERPLLVDSCAITRAWVAASRRA